MTTTQKLSDALNKCYDLFAEIRGDWSDPRAECREGFEVITQALADHEAAQKSLPEDRDRPDVSDLEFSLNCWGSLYYEDGCKFAQEILLEHSSKISKALTTQPESLTHDELFKRFPFFTRLQTTAVRCNFTNGLIIKDGGG